MSAVLKPDYQLRPMQLEDLDAIMAIEPTVYSHPWSRGNFRDALNSGNSAWVMLKDQQIMAYALMLLALDEAQLLNISVAKTSQNQGFGRLMLEHMMTTARHYGAVNMFLEVRVSNSAAIHLYEQLGFCEMALRRAYYPADPKLFKTGREDAFLMGMAL